MTAKVHPRQLVHRGHIDCAGFYLDRAAVSAHELRRRIWDETKRGSVTVLRSGEGYVVLWPKAKHVDTSACSGTPLRREGSFLCAAPLTLEERQTLGAPSGSLVRIVDGAALIQDIGEEVDLSAWLDLSEFVLHAGEPLGSPPAGVTTLAVEPRVPSRSLFGPKIPPPSDRALALQAQFAQQNRLASKKAAPQPWIACVTKLFARRASAPTRRALPAVAKPRASTPLTRLLNSGMSFLQRLVGRKQAAYVREMVGLFENGDFEKALRHAIALGVDPATRGLPTLGALAPRADLAFSTPGIGGSLNFGSDFYAQMRRLYRQAFQTLKRQGRIDEAAFVLGELLGSSAEAISFLERSDRKRAAAELAEMRGLAAGLQIRQWWLAGDRSRALEIALRTGAYADGIARLGALHAEEAKTLRMEWAAELARNGEPQRAVEVVWPLESERRATRAWMEQVIELGGPPAARMSVRMLSAFPEESETLRAELLEILRSTEASRRDERQALLAELASEFSKRIPRDVRVLMRAAFRTAVADRSSLASNLAKLSGDDSLKEEIPKGLTDVSTAALEPLDITVPAQEAGTLAIQDAYRLPNGQWLVGLGEGGVRLSTRDGRTVAHWDVPAAHLVVSSSGHQALAIARRGALWRISRIDLSVRRAASWTDAALTTWIATYEDRLWFVAVGDTVHAIDTRAADWRSLWQVTPQARGEVHALNSSPTQLHVIVAAEPDFERWTYALPGPTLRARQELTSNRVIGSPLVTSSGDVLVRLKGPPGIGLWSQKNLTEQELRSDQGLVPLLSEWAMVDLYRAEIWQNDARVQTHLRVFRRPNALVAQVVLEGVRRARVRWLDASSLVVTDERGRLISLAIPPGKIERLLL